MADYHRYFVPGGTYFFTLVTHQRIRLFAADTARTILGDVMRASHESYPVEVLAIVLLPDHLHTLWSLPAGDDRYGLHWNWIKGEFTRRWLADGGSENRQSAARSTEGRRGIWQRRYWEHTIQDENDLEQHFDYIHYNPVKHRYAERPADWQWSSFHRWVEHGHYDANWGANYKPIDLPGNAGE